MSSHLRTIAPKRDGGPPRGAPRELPLPRKNVRMACRQCRTARRKCDELRPSCSSCVRLSKVCEFDGVDKRKKDSWKYAINALEQENKNLEETIQQLKSNSASESAGVGQMQSERLAGDPACVGRGAGRFSPSLYPVRIPTSVRYCEAVISLLCRDRGGAYEGYWIVLLTYMMEYVDGTSILNEEALAQPYRRFYHAMKRGDLKMYLILDEVRRDLKGLMYDPAAGK